MMIHSRTGLLFAGTLVVALIAGCGAGQDTGASSGRGNAVVEHEQHSLAVNSDQDSGQQASAVGMANPATEHCIKLDGTLDYVQGDAGEIIMCHLPDGTVMEEWALYRRDMGQEASTVTD